MSSRYFITHQQATLNCSTLTVNMTSGTAQHLWLLYSFKDPFVRPRPYRNQQSERPHQNNFSLEIQGDVEQQEPGNTIDHTFVLPWPYATTRLYFYSINQGTGGLKATRSPIFAYEITPQILFEETWSVTGKPDLQWYRNGNPVTNVPYNGGGTVLLRGSIDTADYVELVVGDLIDRNPATLCNMFVRVETRNFLLGFPTDSAHGEIIFVYANAIGQTSARNGLFTFPHDPCSIQPTNYVYPASPSATIGFPVSPMMLTLPNICGEPNDPPIADAWLHVLRLFASSAGPLDPFREWFFPYGKVQIGTTAGTLTDVSGQWRHKRIAPFLA